MHTVLAVEAHIIEQRLAQWCARCSLPSRTEADIALVWPDTLTTFARFTGSFCEGCGE